MHFKTLWGTLQVNRINWCWLVRDDHANNVHSRPDFHQMDSFFGSSFSSLRGRSNGHIHHHPLLMNSLQMPTASDKYSNLKFKKKKIKDKINRLVNIEIYMKLSNSSIFGLNLHLDFFLPMCSLSTVSSFHLTFFSADVRRRFNRSIGVP